MYKQYFGFSEEPFGITPDPRFFYENPIYREASTTLERGIEGRRGLMTLVGAVGTGKTTVLRRLVAHASPAVRFVLADYPPASFDELLSFISRELGLPTPESRGRLHTPDFAGGPIRRKRRGGHVLTMGTAGRRVRATDVIVAADEGTYAMLHVSWSPW